MLFTNCQFIKTGGKTTSTGQIARVPAFVSDLLFPKGAVTILDSTVVFNGCHFINNVAQTGAAINAQGQQCCYLRGAHAFWSWISASRMFISWLKSCLLCSGLDGYRDEFLVLGQRRSERGWRHLHLRRLAHRQRHRLCAKRRRLCRRR